MNAVKRCLALFAVTLVVGACGSDQTADDAGTNLHIRTTPGAVWTRHNSTPATFVVDAIDNLGGNTEGSWDVESVTGPMTVDLDTAYQSTSNGPLGLAARFIVTPTAAGDGFVVVTGTGGTDTVPVRIAPDTGAFAVVFSDSSSALQQLITATAPTGIVFTSATTVRFYTGPQARDTGNGGLSFPVVTSLSADSTQITFVTGPGANGTARFTGLGSRSTPTLNTTARADFAMTAPTPTVDTNAFSVSPTFKSTGNRTTTSVLDTLILVAPATYSFLANTTVEFFRLAPTNPPSTTNPTGYTVSNGTSNPVIVYRSANLDTLKVLVAPGLRGRLKVNPIAFDVNPGIRFMVRGPSSETFDLRSPPTAAGPDTANFAIPFSKASPIAEGDTVTATAPAGMVFLPGTVMINTTTAGTPSGGDSARIVLFSADSTKVTFRLPPGATGKFRYSRMARRDNPAIVWSGRSAATISAVAAPAVVASLTPGTANMNDTVSVALDPAGPYRFRPTSTAEFGGFTAAWAGVSGDSLTLQVLPTPGTAASPLTLTNIRYANLPTFQVKANTASNLVTNAPFSLGPDNALNDGTAPVYARTVTLANGGSIGFYDQATFGAPDWLGFGNLGGRGQQDFKFILTNAGTYSFTVEWAGTQALTDIDIAMVDGLLDHAEATALTANKPESFSLVATANSVHFLSLGFFDGVNPGWVRITVRRTA